MQVPSEYANGMTTRSPAFTFRTSAPTSSTTPMASWPILRPLPLGSIVLYGHRSLPQMQARVTRRSASVRSIRRASGTLSIRTSPAPYMTVARMLEPPFLSESWKLLYHQESTRPLSGRVSIDPGTGRTSKPGPATTPVVCGPRVGSVAGQRPRTTPRPTRLPWALSQRGDQGGKHAGASRSVTHHAGGHGVLGVEDAPVCGRARAVHQAGQPCEDRRRDR